MVSALEKIKKWKRGWGVFEQCCYFLWASWGRESLTSKVPTDQRPEVSKGLDPINMWRTIYLFQAVGRASAKTTSMTTFGMFDG